MNRLALGTVQFGLPYGVANKTGQVSLEETKKILNLATAEGFDILDTGMMYGQSEKRLGELGVSQWNIVSKLPPLPKSCPNVTEWLNISVSNSLKSLNVTYLHGLLLHSPQELLGKNGTELYRSLVKIKQSGLIKNIGISIYIPEELDELLHRYRIDIVQAPFNIFDQRLITSNWLTKLKKMDIEVHVRSVFLQGLLLMDASERPKYFSKWDGLWSEWHEWLKKNNISPLQACLGFALAQPEIDRVIVGMDSVQQLQEILTVTNVSIPQPPFELIYDHKELLNPSNWNENLITRKKHD